jgi:hypothetical protein
MHTKILAEILERETYGTWKIYMKICLNIWRMQIVFIWLRLGLVAGL